jgi:hypothetical protein
MIRSLAARVFLLVVLGVTLAACRTAQAPVPGQQGASDPRPNWSQDSYARHRSDDAWHFAYAAQSWAVEHNGHLIMVPARHNIVVPKSYFAEEFSHVPLRAFAGVDPKAPDRILVLKHGWTTHASSWDFDTDVKFVMFGPGFIKQNVRLDKTTLQNIAPTYAQLIGTEPPKGSMGRVMSEALVSSAKHPRAILTIVMDGGGLSLYRAWPDAWPVIAGLAARGVEYMDAKVTQLETATGPSQAAIGTGGYPFTTRIVGNDVLDPTQNRVTGSFDGFSPKLMSAPTLADEYGVKTGHRAVVISASFSAMPALGMAGHGASLDPGNKSQIVVFFGRPTKPAWKEQFPGAESDSRLMTNIDLFRFPSYLQGRTPNAYVQELTSGKGTWMGHKIDGTADVAFIPAGVRFECDNMLMMMDREPIDQADVTALIYMNFKGADLSSHRWGLESIETRDNLAAQDACIGKLVQKLNERVGEGNYVITITADHGMAPLPELVNGHRILLPHVLELIDGKFQAKISLGGGFINLWFDQAQMKKIGITNQDIAHYLRSLTAGEYYGSRDQWPTYLPYLPDEKLFFNVYTAEQVKAQVDANPTRWMANPYAGDGRLDGRLSYGPSGF